MGIMADAGTITMWSAMRDSVSLAPYDAKGRVDEVWEMSERIELRPFWHQAGYSSDAPNHLVKLNILVSRMKAGAEKDTQIIPERDLVLYAEFW